MNEKDERNLRVIEATRVETKAEPEEKTVRHTNPIAKKFLDFRRENAGKFSVRDLFRR